jgi:signal transduction histidine kinase
MNLRLKVSLLIIVPMLLILIASTSVAYSRQREQALESMSLLASQTGEVIERSLQEAMLAADVQRMQSTFDAVGDDPRIRALYLLDPNGQIVFSPRGTGVGERLSNSDPTCQPCHSLEPAQRPSGIVVTNDDGETVFRSMHPIENRPECHQCHDPQQRLNGLLLADLSIEPVETTIAADLRSNLTWWTGTVVVIAVLANWAVNRWVLSRLSGIAEAIENVGDKGLAANLPDTPTDEIGKLSAAINTMAGQVSLREQENAALSAALQERAEERGRLLERLISAQEEERMRVARELHDELGQSLSSTSLNVELAQRAFQEQDKANADDHLEQAQGMIADATDRMYQLIHGLRPSALDDLGLVAALRAHAEQVLKPAGIAFDLEASTLGERLPPAVETALFRIHQEAMTNVLRHAEAERVQIRLAREGGGVVAEIQDNGVGFDPTGALESGPIRPSYGLLGMRERAILLGGQIEFESSPGEGTLVRVRIPLEESSNG